jgi:uncharacterized membrane protein YhfC
MLLSGPLMLLVALLFIIGWKRRSHVAFRWFLVGAGVWTVGVIMKFVAAAGISIPVYFALGKPTDFAAALSQLSWGWILLSALCSGALTGVFEIGVTYLAARIWRSMAADAGRAVAIGIGAGAFEAILLGLSLAAFLGIAMTLSEFPRTEVFVKKELMRSMAITPLLWLLPAVERTLALLCHISSRALVLLSVAKKRLSYFWYGFLILTAVDAVAGYFHAARQVGKISTWWILLAIVPFAIISIPTIRWCIRNWPKTEMPVEAASEDLTIKNG